MHHPCLQNPLPSEPPEVLGASLRELQSQRLPGLGQCCSTRVWPWTTVDHAVRFRNLGQSAREAPTSSHTFCGAPQAQRSGLSLKGQPGRPVSGLEPCVSSDCAAQAGYQLPGQQTAGGVGSWGLGPSFAQTADPQAVEVTQVPCVPSRDQGDEDGRCWQTQVGFPSSALVHNLARHQPLGIAQWKPRAHPP